MTEEAEAADEPVPDHVYLTLEANASVTQASRSRRASRTVSTGSSIVRISARALARSSRSINSARETSPKTTG